MLLEVEETRLAYITRLCAGLADLCHFETHACARISAEDSEQTQVPHSLEEIQGYYYPNRPLLQTPLRGCPVRRVLIL